MGRREHCRKVLDAELLRWSGRLWDQIVADLRDSRAYGAVFELKLYEVEVQILEDTDEHVHVMLSVDDGNLAGSILPLSCTFISRNRGQARQFRS